MPQIILDSHIHLWPTSAANSQSHDWMREGEQLTKQYSVEDFVKASDQPRFNVNGFIYVETDRAVEAYVETDMADEQVFRWALEPFAELAFLRRIVEGTHEHEEGFDASHSSLLKGIIAWAPLNRIWMDFHLYVTAVEVQAGNKTWSRVKGFRYLLQGCKDEKKFVGVVQSFHVITNLQYLGRRGFSFDVGVDQRQGGVWQLEHFVEVIKKVHDGVQPDDRTVFILNHLCKPDMEQAPNTNAAKEENFGRWKSCISQFAEHGKVYMKLSGAFSEMADQDPNHPLSIPLILERMRPWLDHIFDTFTPQRIMFGSDWPVCNVRGPGDARSWSYWVEVVDQAIRERGLSEEEMNRVWYGTAAEAYRIPDIAKG